MKEFIGVDSLSFLSVNGLYKAMGHKKGRNDKQPAYTDHCFTGEYPTPLYDQTNNDFKKQLSLLLDFEND